MNKTLEQAIEQARALPEDMQDEVGAILLNVVARCSAGANQFSPDQISQIRKGIAQIRHGETVSEADIEALFEKHLKRLA